MDFPSSATLYSVQGINHDRRQHLNSARLRYLACEKNPQIVLRTANELPQHFQPYVQSHSFPVLLDKSILVFGNNALENYLLEKYLGEPLLPSDPNNRAKVRMLHDDIVNTWYDTPQLDTTHLDELASVLPDRSKWFAGPMMTLIDVALAPFLWLHREYIHHHLPPFVTTYALRLFHRSAFQQSLPATDWAPPRTAA